MITKKIGIRFIAFALLFSFISIGAVYAASLSKVKINANDRIVEVYTGLKEPEDILNQYGVEYTKDDKITYIDGEIILTKPKNVEIHVGTEYLEVKTHAATVEEVLKENGIEIDELDKVTPSRSTPITEDMEVEYIDYSLAEEVVDSSIPYEVEVVYNYDKEVGDDSLFVEGAEGSKEVYYNHLYAFGQLKETTIEKEVVTLEPVNRVEEKGSMKKVSYSLDYETVYKEDSTSYIGTETVEPGQAGSAVDYYRVDDNGETYVETVVLSEPVNSVVWTGTKEYEEVSTPSQSYSYEEPKSYDSTPSYNQVGSEAEAKEWIAQKESGGSYTAYNPNGGYYGRYQLNPSLINYGAPPAEQEAAADAYVYARYGSWVKAQIFWMNNGWY